MGHAKNVQTILNPSKRVFLIPNKALIHQMCSSMVNFVVLKRVILENMSKSMEHVDSAPNINYHLEVVQTVDLSNVTIDKKHCPQGLV